MPATKPMSAAAIDASEAHARRLDNDDPLATRRAEFHIPHVPRNPWQEAVYLCGNSLGLQPKAARQAVLQELDDWARFGVEGHFHAAHPWFGYHEFLRDASARLVGALPHEVVCMNSLSVNLHLLMISFYRPTAERFKIIIEDAAFPSDSYAVQSQAALHGLDPRRAVVRLAPRPGEAALRPDDVLAAIEREGPALALVLLGGVNYLTGQLFDIPAITAAAHKAGALCGWDLAHAAGNADVRLHDADADFACWCSYKYLNGGPGAVAGAFIHERWSARLAPPSSSFAAPDRIPLLGGWWGNDPKDRFRMGPDFAPVQSADAWQLSNPPILAMAPVRVSLELFDSIRMPALRAKSRRLTAYLEALIDDANTAGAVEILTPRDPEARGCQLSLAVAARPKDLHAALLADGVVCDFREPNVIRVAPAPLYNTFHDCWRFAEILRRHIRPA